jgi:NADH-quinone oxidoreductase subunit G
MIKITIDGIELEVEEGITIFNACLALNIEIPHFCYHKKLKIAGNCRMCFVEVEKIIKPVASCHNLVTNNMVIYTNSEMVQKSRSGILEFILINHPLDCPVCDEAGECALQDYVFKYGKNTSKFHENKRIVKDKDLGPLIKTKMTRCIHCMRCVRFATDIAGIEELGSINRGENTEIISYLQHCLTSELSGNMIDLCPVGALNSKPYNSKARSWELFKTYSIDLMDAMGANIRIDSRGSEIMRILPKNDGEFISDKARFSYDANSFQRITNPYIRKENILQPCGWDEAITLVAKKLTETKPDQMAFIAGAFACTESMFLMKYLMKKLQVNNHSYEFDYKFDIFSRSNYLFNINNIEEVDLCLLIGANPRKAAPVFNASIGLLNRAFKMKIARIGNIFDETYNIDELGDNPQILSNILEGSHDFAQQLLNAKNPIFIIGEGIYKRNDAYSIYKLIYDIMQKYKISDKAFNILHNHASIVGCLDTGFYTSSSSITEILNKIEKSHIKLTYLLNSDEIDLKQLKSDSNFIIYQGSHFDRSASIADIILPSTTYYEKSATYVNMEGKVQMTNRAIKPANLVKEDYEIIMNLSQYLNIDLSIKNLDDLRLKLYEHILNINNDTLKFNNSKNIINHELINTTDTNYYMNNNITRSSLNMSKILKSIISQSVYK